MRRPSRCWIIQFHLIFGKCLARYHSNGLCSPWLIDLQRLCHLTSIIEWPFTARRHTQLPQAINYSTKSRQKMHTCLVACWETIRGYRCNCVVVIKSSICVDGSDEQANVSQALHLGLQHRTVRFSESMLQIAPFVFVQA
jgi:hypothetical protein